MKYVIDVEECEHGKEFDTEEKAQQYLDNYTGYTEMEDEE